MKIRTWLLILTCLPIIHARAQVEPVLFLKAEGNALSSSGTNHGVLVGGTSFSKGAVGQGFSFDGVDDRVIIDDNPVFQFGSSLTISGWVRTTNPADFAGLFDKFTDGSVYIGVQISMSGNNGPTPDLPGTLRADVGFGNTYGTSHNSAFVNDGRFHHFALVVDRSQAILYVDGKPGTVADATLWQPQNGDPIVIGADTAIASRHFRGDLDEIVLYNRALSSIELQQLIEAAHPRLSITRTENNSVQLSWSQLAVDWKLQWSSSLDSTNWFDAASGTNNPAVQPADFGAHFFRLFHED